ncbi:MAG: ABC transporter ATP-binding protein [Actinomycetota bacterium]
MTVELRGVRKHFRARRRGHEIEVAALHGVDLEVGEGELMVVVGPSGSGKTTLLRCIAGLERVDSGRVFIGGSDATDVLPGGRDVAMVFQEYALYPHLTVSSNISFGLRARKLEPQEVARRTSHAANLLGLDELLLRRPPELSGGEQQRVALARAIVREPRAFLMDEPLSNLDAELRSRTRADIRQLQRELKTTMVYVTHDQVEAMTMGDRVAVLRHGRIEQVGAPSEVYDRPATTSVATFFGSPSMTLFDAHLAPHADGVERIGVRSEDITLVPPDYAKLTGEVVLVEVVGSDVIVHVDVSGERFVAKTARSNAPAMTDLIGLQFSDEKLHFFDSAGRRV